MRGTLTSSWHSEKSTVPFAITELSSKKLLQLSRMPLCKQLKLSTLLRVISMSSGSSSGGFSESQSFRRGSLRFIGRESSLFTPMGVVTIPSISEI